MADTFLTPEPVDDDELDPAALRYVAASARLEVGANVLRVFAYLSAVVWAITVVCSAWVTWDQLESFPSGGTYMSQASDNHRLQQTIVSVAGSTWPYLLVAIAAYGAALLVDARRLDGLLEAVIDEAVDDEAAEDG